MLGMGAKVVVRVRVRVVMSVTGRMSVALTGCARLSQSDGRHWRGTAVD